MWLAINYLRDTFCPHLQYWSSLELDMLINSKMKLSIQEFHMIHVLNKDVILMNKV